MLNTDQATQVVRANLPEGKIQAIVRWNGLYLFQIFGDDPDEGEWDPFYSVDMNTGQFNDFSILTDGPTAELNALFVKAKGGAA